MLVVFINTRGFASGKVAIEDGFVREGDYLVNEKVIRAKCYGEITSLLLYPTNDIETRLLDQQNNLLIVAYPYSLSDIYFRTGSTKLFPIHSLRVPIYSKWHYQDKWEPPTEELMFGDKYEY